MESGNQTNKSSTEVEHTKDKQKHKGGFHEGRTKTSESKEKNANTVLDGLTKTAFKAYSPAEKPDTIPNGNDDGADSDEEHLQNGGNNNNHNPEKKVEGDSNGAKDSKQEEEIDNSPEAKEIAEKLPQEIEEGNIEYKVCQFASYSWSNFNLFFDSV